MSDIDVSAACPAPLPVSLRPEQPGDYHAITEITTLAHHTEAEVALLVASLRQHPAYDPELSLVAEAGDRIVGHVIFLPLDMLISGLRVRAAALWVLTVAPDSQRRRVGARLVEAGHGIARRKGCRLAFLLGHDTYYPRFGYRTHMFGACRARVSRATLRSWSATRGPVNVAERVVQPADVEALVDMWWRWFTDVDLAILPGTSVTDWLSPYKPMCDAVLTRDGAMVGYARYEREEPHDLRCFLARDREATADLLAYLSDRVMSDLFDEILVPVHPRSRAARELLPPGYREDVEPWSAAMIAALDPRDRLVGAYIDEVASGARPIGCVIWPVQGDVA